MTTITITQDKHSVVLEFPETTVTRTMIIERLKTEERIELSIDESTITLNDGHTDLEDTNVCSKQTAEFFLTSPPLLRHVRITDNTGVTILLCCTPDETVADLKAELIDEYHVVTNDENDLKVNNITLNQGSTQLDDNNAALRTLGTGDLQLTFTGLNGIQLKDYSKAKDDGILSNIKGKANMVHSHVPTSLYVGFGAGAVLRFCHLAATSPQAYSSHIKSSLICGVGIGLGAMGVHALYQKFVKGESLAEFFSFE